MQVTADEILKLPRAESQPPVTDRQWHMRDAQHRAACAPTEAIRQVWLQRYEQARAGQ